jgi:hypothetical protein
MEQFGRVQEWHDDKGYGFIAALDDTIAARRVSFTSTPTAREAGAPRSANWCGSS